MLRHYFDPAEALRLTPSSPPDFLEMDIKTEECLLTDWEGDLLVIGYFENSIRRDINRRLQNTRLEPLDSKLDGVLGELMFENDFQGRLGQVSTVRISHGNVKRVALVGLGRGFRSLDAVYASDTWRVLGSKSARLAKESNLCTLGVGLVDSDLMNEPSKLAAVEAIASGAILGTYEDTRFKAQITSSSLRTVSIISLGTGKDRVEALATAFSTTAGVILAKQLVAAPANVITPVVLADVAVSIATAYSDVLTVLSLEQHECEALGMGAFLAVAKASEMPAKLIHVKYTPPGGLIYRRVAIVGKGVCFESGGYNIKRGTRSEIELMKYDMAGTGAALGAALAIAHLKPAGVEVHFISAVCESMISGNGLRPGDIVTAANGKTIEVISTDAGGRLPLADSLVYACNLHIDAILDIATLTGECISALGPDVGALFTSSETMGEQILASARRAGEKIWRLPLNEWYIESLESSIADIKNSGGPDGSTMKAALFLKEFISIGREWAHLDITGPAWDRKLGTATGYPVRTIVKWIMELPLLT